MSNVTSAAPVAAPEAAASTAPKRWWLTVGVLSTLQLIEFARMSVEDELVVQELLAEDEAAEMASDCASGLAKRAFNLDNITR